jgi:hypothetical protein
MSDVPDEYGKKRKWQSKEGKEKEVFRNETGWESEMGRVEIRAACTQLRFHEV